MHEFLGLFVFEKFVHIKIDVVVVEHTIAYIHPNSEIGLGFVEDAISEYRESPSASFT